MPQWPQPTSSDYNFQAQKALNLVAKGFAGILILKLVMALIGFVVFAIVMMSMF